MDDWFTTIAQMDTEEKFKVEINWDNLFQKLGLNYIDAWESEFDGICPILDNKRINENDIKESDHQLDMW